MTQFFNLWVPVLAQLSSELYIYKFVSFSSLISLFLSLAESWRHVVRLFRDRVRHVDVGRMGYNDLGVIYCVVYDAWVKKRVYELRA